MDEASGLREMYNETYAGAGVSLGAAVQAKELIKGLSASTLGPQVLQGPGLFAGMYQLEGLRNPVLVSSTDGVGTKLKVASQASRYDTIGVDLVNHCINDILTLGARPLFFLDYIAMGTLIPSRVEALVHGMAQACRAVGCALIGGETAEMPSVYRCDDFDIAGFIVGAVERKAVLDGSTIREGDLLLGLLSSGLHTNGYSLVRRVFRLEDRPSLLWRSYPELGCTMGEALLKPHRCYYPLLEPVLPLINGMAHITGGGLEGNVPRILPQGLSVEIRKGAWEVPSIFTLIQDNGGVEEKEMYRVFNMGIGMVLVCSPDKESEVCMLVPEAKLIGRVIEQVGNQRLVFA